MKRRLPACTEGGIFMRNLVLILIAFMAVVTFIRAFDNPKTAQLPAISPQVIEVTTNN
jgi:hypothetical protein